MKDSPASSDLKPSYVLIPPPDNTNPINRKAMILTCYCPCDFDWGEYAAMKTILVLQLDLKPIIPWSSGYGRTLVF